MQIDVKVTIVLLTYLFSPYIIELKVCLLYVSWWKRDHTFSTNGEKIYAKAFHCGFVYECRIKQTRINNYFSLGTMLHSKEK